MGKPTILEFHGHLQMVGFLHVSYMFEGYVTLQLDLPVDEPVITGSGIVSDKMTLCRFLLEKIPDKFEDETKLGIYHIVHVIPRDVLGHTTEVGVNQWLSAPTAVVGLVATTVSTFQGDRPIYVPIDVVRRHRCHILRPTESVGKLVDVGRECAIDSVHNDENARNRPGVEAVRVEATNFAATIRPKGTVQGGHVRVGQHRLADAAQGAHQGVGCNP
ncbi:hypothetical protein Gogos_002126 [Gossypium gossypioides]|uniref:Uncharacterized protein n=1 Tax=Gossypium gossypioides TaxID=34282 RepID=A0A7J9CQN8_GOSGO|nr:hypothetical protein [Gossypium gossypioides]